MRTELVIVEVDIPHEETMFETDTPIIEENPTQDYQLVSDRERRQINSNPSYESQNLNDFSLILGEGVNYSETSF